MKLAEKEFLFKFGRFYSDFFNDNETCSVCNYYPLTRNFWSISCKGCNIFKKYSKIVNGSDKREFTKNISIGPYFREEEIVDKDVSEIGADELKKYLLSHLILHSKTDKETRLFCGNLLASFVKSYHSDILNGNPIVTFVPNFPSSNLQRISEISSTFAGNLKLTHDTLLKQIKDIPKQRRLNAEKRFQNVKEAFQIINSNTFNQKDILLIDDICTTMATQNECSKLLIQEGAKSVISLTLGRNLI